MKLLVCGGRDFEDIQFVFRHLESIYKQVGEITTIVHGGAKGADKAAGIWADIFNIPTEVYEAEWNKYGKAAGGIRNKEMLEKSKPDGLIAFPGGRGTDHMWKHANQMSPEIRYWRSQAVLFCKEDPIYGFLSNFALGFGFTDENGNWNETSEHGFQARKAIRTEDRRYILEAPTPFDAKKRGGEVLTFDNWDQRKKKAMLDTLRLKFAEGTEAAEMLINTGIDYLMENSPWDSYWGIGKNRKGENNLGCLLMSVRDLFL